MENQEELNYKQVYYYLFNQLTDIIAYLQLVQKNCEAIFIGELSPENMTEINPLNVITKLAEHIQNNKDCQ